VLEKLTLRLGSRLVGRAVVMQVVPDEPHHEWELTAGDQDRVARQFAPALRTRRPVAHPALEAICPKRRHQQAAVVDQYLEGRDLAVAPLIVFERRAGYTARPVGLA
jgi:hypothetical protein